MSGKMTRVLRKVLIANRGEIARRVMKTAKRMSIRTVAVYSDADRDAPHVADADEAVRVGPAETAKSYLNMDAVLSAAKTTGADAIHPGYGFLSENAEFAETCAQSGLEFVGPPFQAIREMGSKSAARRLMAEAGVPIIPGYHGEDQSDDRVLDEARRIGYPVMIKPVMGGGGKGMRVASNDDEFLPMVKSSREEALPSFGDDRVLLEKFIARSRHIEVQVFADKLGNCVHLWERDCSVQRRHQKIIEEAPAPGLTDAQRSELGEAAKAAARKVNYESAGTVEFIMDVSDPDEPSFYFLEMNTRLQVEHPVTELITGQDLVEWQFLVAQGRALPITQQGDMPLLGHSMEARIYAESPRNDFLPQAGTLRRFRFPADTEEDGFLRVDQGVREGDYVSVFYDPMIAKVIVKGKSREEARVRLEASLQGSQVMGIDSNVAFAGAILRHPSFVDGSHDTSLLEANGDALLAVSDQDPPPGDISLAAVGFVMAKKQAFRHHFPAGSAFAELGGFSLHEPAQAIMELDGRVLQIVETDAKESSYVVREGDQAIGTVSVHHALESAVGELALDVTVQDVRFDAVWVLSDDQIGVYAKGNTGGVYTLPSVEMESDDDSAENTGEFSLKAPIPGRIKGVHIREGEAVGRGAILVSLEAMKMVHTLQSPGDGTVTAIQARDGDVVGMGDVIVRVHLNSSPATPVSAQRAGGD